MTGKAPWAEELHREGKFPLGWRNTLSNLAYAAVGLALVVHYQDQASAVIGVGMMLLATGSGLFHAYGSAKHEHARRLDWLGMMAVAGIGVGAGIVPGSIWEPVLMGLGALVGMGMYWLNRWRSRDLWVVLALILGSIRPALEGHGLLVLVAWGCAGLAYLCWTLDRKQAKIVGLWGHALWHVFMAAAIGALYVAQHSGG